MCEQDFIDAVHNLPDSTEGRFEFGLSSTQMEQLSRAMPGFEWEEPPKAVVHCAVFDRFLPSQFLNGAVVSAWATGHTKNKVTVDIGERKLELSIIFTLEFDTKRKELKIKFSYDLPDEFQSEIELFEELSENYPNYNYDNIISNSKTKDAFEQMIATREFVIHKFAKTSWLSALFGNAIGNCVIVHNGIVAETEKDILTGRTENIGAIILLKDKYRPNIDISRNNVNRLNAAPAIVLSLLEKQLLKHGIKVELDFSVLDDAKYRYIPLAQWFEVLRDVEDISDCLMIKTEKNESRSLNELLSIVKSKGETLISSIYILNFPHSSYHNSNLLKYVTIALLQRHFKCKLMNKHKIQIELPCGDEIQNIAHFPAMFFVEFSGEHHAKFTSDKIRLRYACNINHALSHWIILNQLALRERVPGILLELIRNVIEENRDSMIDNVKRLLDIVKALPNNPIPVPDYIYLSEDDFYPIIKKSP